MPEQLEKLKLINVKKCKSVGDVVEAMSFCSFGARMLGQVANTLFQLIEKKEPITILYDGKTDTRLANLLKEMVQKNWIKQIIRSHEFDRKTKHRKNLLVIGNFVEYNQDNIFQLADKTIFINQYGLAKPGQVKDGFYPDVVFSDPNYILPILYLTLLEWLDERPSKTSDLIKLLSQFNGLAHEITHGAETFVKMVKDKDCEIFLTLSGAMTIAKMSLLIIEMIEQGWVKYISSTGALIAHGLVESVGLKHFKYDPKIPDEKLLKLKLNRVTDTLEPESNLDHLEKILEDLFESLDPQTPTCTVEINRKIGQFLAERYPEDKGILKSAFSYNVPVQIPAFIDSEVGNDLYLFNKIKRIYGSQPLILNLEKDAELLLKRFLNARKAGIFSIGGGVPRNNVQNSAPLAELVNNRFNLRKHPKMFSYGLRICPDPMYYGHLSGCTYQEGISWGKFSPEAVCSEIHADATLVWPFIVKYALENL